MELKKMREMTDVELAAELEKMKKELFNLRFQHVTGQLENPVKMREVKRNICLLYTSILSYGAAVLRLSVVSREELEAIPYVGAKIKKWVDK